MGAPAGILRELFNQECPITLEPLVPTTMVQLGCGHLNSHEGVVDLFAAKGLQVKDVFSNIGKEALLTHEILCSECKERVYTINNAHILREVLLRATELIQSERQHSIDVEASSTGSTSSLATSAAAPAPSSVSAADVVIPPAPATEHLGTLEVTASTPNYGVSSLGSSNYTKLFTLSRHETFAKLFVLVQKQANELQKHKPICFRRKFSILEILLFIKDDEDDYKQIYPWQRISDVVSSTIKSISVMMYERCRQMETFPEEVLQKTNHLLTGDEAGHSLHYKQSTRTYDQMIQESITQLFIKSFLMNDISEIFPELYRHQKI